MTSDLEQEHTGLLQAQFQRASCHLALHTGCHRALVFLAPILSNFVTSLSDWWSWFVQWPLDRRMAQPHFLHRCRALQISLGELVLDFPH